MKFLSIVFAGSLLLSSSLAFAYTRQELEKLSKDTLVEIILDLQDAGPGGGGRPQPKQCSTYLPEKNEKGSILNPLNNPGYTNHGTIKYPNGQTFMLRNSGYTNDYTFYYPNGTVMLVKNSGYTNHGTVNWPNGKTLLKENKGYTDHGSVFHSDGSSWLLRNSGYTNDRQRTGLPVETVKLDDGVSVKAKLTTADSVTVSTILKGSGYSVEISLDGATKEVKVKECL
jgi:hypothetical protein